MNVCENSIEKITLEDKRLLYEALERYCLSELEKRHKHPDTFNAACYEEAQRVRCAMKLEWEDI